MHAARLERFEYSRFLPPPPLWNHENFADALTFNVHCLVYLRIFIQLMLRDESSAR